MPHKITLIIFASKFEYNELYRRTKMERHDS
jgi:hypothetical protein